MEWKDKTANAEQCKKIGMKPVTELVKHRWFDHVSGLPYKAPAMKAIEEATRKAKESQRRKNSYPALNDGKLA